MMSYFFDSQSPSPKYGHNVFSVGVENSTLNENLIAWPSAESFSDCKI